MRRGTYLVVALLVAVCVIGGGTLAAQVITKPASAAKQASWAPHLYKTANGYPKGNGSGHVSKAGLPPNPHAADLTYFGGPVELQPTAYIVFWGPGWGTQASPSMDAQVIQSFWQNAGHSQYDNLLSQYHDAAGHYISNSLTLGGKFWDPSPPPTSTTTACGAVNAVTDASIEAEVTTLIGNGTFPADHNNATYFVYTPNGDAVNAGSACSGTQFCAYHSYTGNQVGNGYAYAAEPYPLFPGNPAFNCVLSSWPTPNNDANADALANSSSHEVFEAITDPIPAICPGSAPGTFTGCPGIAGWFHYYADNVGNPVADEIGDECAYIFPNDTGTGGINPNGGTTIVNNNGHFYLQTEYSNATHDCQSYRVPKTAGVYYPATSTFYLSNHNAGGNADQVVNFGFAGTVPLVGDWTGKGYESVGVYNPANGVFYLKNSDGGGNADTAFQFGPPNSIPLVGDWNGDGVDTVGVYFPANGTFYLRNTNTGGDSDLAFSYGPVGGGVAPVVGDWNGDGVDTVGIDLNTVFYLKNTNAAGNGDVAFQYGPAGVTPVSGDFAGLRASGIGVYAPSNGIFYLRSTPSAGNADAQFGYGPPNSKPVMGVFVSLGGGPLLP